MPTKMEDEHPGGGRAITPIGAATQVILPSGRRLEAELEPGGADVLRIRARDGQCVLTVRITDEGPVLSFSGATLELEARRLDVSCDDLRLRVGGAAVVDIGGDVDARVANDDVALKGERVLLNSDDPPMPLSMAEYRARRLAASQGEPKALAPADERNPDED
ncbi:MAG: hypothetical protein ACMG6S_28890 [Byssovorax sp.]